MTNTKKITNLDALEIMEEVAQGALFDTCVKNSPFTEEEIVAKIEHMADVARKRAAAPKKPTKEQIANLEMTKHAVALMKKHGEPVGTKWLMENVEGIMKPQKATAIMTKAIQSGWVEKSTPVKGSARWEVVK